MSEEYSVAYEFNKIQIKVNHLRGGGADVGEVARLYRAVGRSRQATDLYLYFTQYGYTPVDPFKLLDKIPESTIHRLLRTFSDLGLIEKAGTSSRSSKGGPARCLWRMVV